MFSFQYLMYEIEQTVELMFSFQYLMYEIEQNCTVLKAIAT